MTKKEKKAKMQAEEYARKEAVAEQATAEQIERETAPFLLEKIEQDIQHDYGLKPPFDSKTLSNEIPWFMFDKWNKYNNIVNPDTKTSENIANPVESAKPANNHFGIDFGKSAKDSSLYDFTAEDIHKEEFVEKPEVPKDAPKSVHDRDLPKGTYNICDDDFSFDECDSEDELSDYDNFNM